jgi:hypothetical protein
MPANSTGTIAVNVDIDTYTPATRGAFVASGLYEFSPQDGTVRFRNIPAVGAGGNTVGLLVVLPDNPSDGDTYEFVDADGSLSVGPTLATTHDIIVTIADAGNTGRNFEGTGAAAPAPLVAIGLVAPFSGGRFQFDAKHNAWLFTQWASPLFNAQKEVATTGNAPIAPSNFAGGAAANLIAFLMPVNTGLGLYSLQLMLLATLAAADADFELDVSIVTNVTAFSGGTLIGAALPAPQIRYNGGSPVVVTGDAPVACQGTKQDVATGNIAAVMSTITELVQLSKATAALTLGTAVVVAIKTAAQAVSAMSMSASLRLVE